MEFTEKELAAFREEVCKGASDAQFDLFISEAIARNLRPGTHLFFQLRNVNEWDSEVGAKVRKQRATWITKIDAFRLISQRTGKDAGRGKTRWIYLDDKKAPTIESTVPLPHPTAPNTPLEPYACVVPIYRSDYKEPIEVVCRFDAFAVTMKQNNQVVLTDMWQRRGPEQLEKCSEVASRRAAYPEELGSLYLDLEFKNEEETSTPTAVTPASAVPLPPTAPPVNQQPATPTETPRPNEDRKPFPNSLNVSETGDIETYAVEHHVDKVPATLPKNSGPALVVKDAAKEKALAAVPDLKPASELPPPAPKKRGPKPKENQGPVNGPEPVPGQIDDTDIALAETPQAPLEDQTEAAKEFVEGLDPTPTPEEMKGFTARVRALTAKGKKSEEIKAHVLKVAGVDDTKKVTVRAWKQALEELEPKLPEKLGEF